MSAEDGRDFMEEVRYDLHQIQLRYGTVTDKTDVVSDKATKHIPKEEEEEEDDDESRQLSELARVNKLAPLEMNEKPHAGQIVVTTYDPKNKSKNEYTPVCLISGSLHSYTINLSFVTWIQLKEQDRLEQEIKSKGIAANQVKEEHFDETHIVDLLNNEYSLEEIIYQLARILFSQSLSQGIDSFFLSTIQSGGFSIFKYFFPLHRLAGHPEAEEALKKFADFLEKESKEGKMSPQVQRKVLGMFEKLCKWPRHRLTLA